MSGTGGSCARRRTAGAAASNPPALKAAMVKQDPSLKPVIASHPAWMAFPRPPMFVFPQLNADGDLPNEYQLAAAGWGFARIDPVSIQADNQNDDDGDRNLADAYMAMEAIENVLGNYEQGALRMYIEAGA